MISEEDFGGKLNEVEFNIITRKKGNVISFFIEYMDFIYHHFLKDVWFSTFAKPICGMYLYNNILSDSDENDTYSITTLDLILSLFVFIYNSLEYEGDIDLEELYSAVLVTFSNKEIHKNTLDIHYFALELKQYYQETYDNMLYVFGMEKDVVEIEFYKHICPFVIEFAYELLDSPGYHLLLLDKDFTKHQNYGDDDNKIDWWGNIPANRYKSLDEKLRYFCLGLRSD